LEEVRVGILFGIDDTVNGIIRKFKKASIVIVGSWPVQQFAIAVKDKYREKKRLQLILLLLKRLPAPFQKV
jgi:predicted transcriptional regulator